MIALYLKSLAATVRDLVASGKAVHVTHETAPELDLLAELPWNQAPLLVLNERITAPGEREVTARPITPADLALGWLLASRALSQGQIWHDREITCQEVLTRDRQRAAECAELAAISASHVVNGRLTLECLGTGIPLRTTEAHDGTREGARAAWAFVVESLQHRLRLRVADLDAQTFRGQALIPLDDSRVAICDRYRRELEAT